MLRVDIFKALKCISEAHFKNLIAKIIHSLIEERNPLKEEEMEKILVVFVLVPIISLITINVWCGLIDWLARKDPNRYHNPMSDF